MGRLWPARQRNRAAHDVDRTKQPIAVNAGRPTLFLTKGGREQPMAHSWDTYAARVMQLIKFESAVNSRQRTPETERVYWAGEVPFRRYSARCRIGSGSQERSQAAQMGS
jgi:hypothetical protein